MAGRSLQALSQCLRRARISVRNSTGTTNVQSITHLVGRQWSSSAISSSERTGFCRGALEGAGVPGSSRNFSASGARNLGSLGGQRSEYWGQERIGSVSYSSLALESREDSRRSDFSNADEIGYKVLGPYVPEGLKIQPQSAFAVVQVGSHQFKVSPGDMIYTEKLKYADINDQLSLNKVLLLGSLNQTIIGRPIIPDASVLAAVEEHALDAKVIIFKKKRRKNYRRTNGHRQELTRLRILRINGIECTTPAGTDISGEDTD
ncbi:hypothetical protein Mapa_000598 [Marchantia paleacea]|nr:hypothetical protein Mapa_000598 [Marchantia paleacea]